MDKTSKTAAAANLGGINMGGKIKASKTGAKATAAAKKASKATGPAVKTVSRSMRKLLDKNNRKAKAREARRSRAMEPSFTSWG